MQHRHVRSFLGAVVALLIAESVLPSQQIDEYSKPELTRAYFEYAV